MGHQKRESDKNYTILLVESFPKTGKNNYLFIDSDHKNSINFIRLKRNNSFLLSQKFLCVLQNVSI